MEYLKNHPQVEKINHPSLPENGYKDLYDKYFPNGAGSIFTFNIKGSEQEAKDVYRQTADLLSAGQRGRREVSGNPPGKYNSLPADCGEELHDQGIEPNTIRLSIGTENIDDIIADLDQAFNG